MIPELSIRRVVIGYSSFWIIWLFIHAYLLIEFDIPFKLAITDALVAQSVFLMNTVIIFFTLKYYQPTEGNFFYLRIWALLLSIGATYLSYEVLRLHFDGYLYYQQILEKSLTIRFLFQVLLIGMISVLLWFANQNALEQGYKSRKEALEQSAREAELYNLRQQLQPHFLFNSLNSISALAGAQPNQARKMIQQLSEFLRHTLKKDDKQLVTLEEELYQLNLYLEIEKVRFGHRLQTEVHLTSGCETLKLPVLILQPLVENAIKFGLYDTLDAVMIKVNAQCLEKQLLQIEISNPFEPQTSGRVGGTGFGLDSVRRRLYLMYGRNDLIETQIQGNTFVAKVSIPQEGK